MWDFIADHQWLAWFGVAALLGIAELMTLDFVLIMIAAGAASGGLTALVGAPFWLCLLVAAVVSAGSLGLLRPYLLARRNSGPELLTGHAVLVGKTAVVLDEVTDTGGRVRLSGELWSARTYDPDETIPPGTKVRVFEIDGATAVVHPE